MPDHKLYENIYPDKSGCPVDCAATNRPYYVNIPDDVTGIFGRTPALGSTQPLTDMSTKNISWAVNAAGA